VFFEHGSTNHSNEPWQGVIGVIIFRELQFVGGGDEIVSGIIVFIIDGEVVEIECTISLVSYGVLDMGDSEIECLVLPPLLYQCGLNCGEWSRTGYGGHMTSSIATRRQKTSANVTSFSVPDLAIDTKLMVGAQPWQSNTMLSQDGDSTKLVGTFLLKFNLNVVILLD
jgi:hypothetical protein